MAPPHAPVELIAFADTINMVVYKKLLIKHFASSLPSKPSHGLSPLTASCADIAHPLGCLGEGEAPGGPPGDDPPNDLFCGGDSPIKSCDESTIPRQPDVFFKLLITFTSSISPSPSFSISSLALLPIYIISHIFF